MGKNRSKHYQRYTLAYKQQAVRLADHPGVKARDIAEALGIHPVMLYRWRMEYRRGELRENLHMGEVTDGSPKRRKRTDPLKAKEEELSRANRRIRQLEKELATRRDEIELLKKAERFFHRTE